MKPIKHKSASIKKLLAFAAAINVKVVFIEAGETCWIPKTRTIKLEEEEDDGVFLASFLHELGHALDDILSHPARYARRIDRSYIAIYKEVYSIKQLALVMSIEKRAWSLGRDIGRRLKIPLGKWYTDYEKECLKSYGNP